MGGAFPVAEEAGDTCLALPLSSVMTEEQVDVACDTVPEMVAQLLRGSRW